jgi:hypothetical protein
MDEQQGSRSWLAPAWDEHRERATGLTLGGARGQM